MSIVFFVQIVGLMLIAAALVSLGMSEATHLQAKREQHSLECYKEQRRFEEQFSEEIRHRDRERQAAADAELHQAVQTVGLAIGEQCQNAQAGKAKGKR